MRNVLSIAALALILYPQVVLAVNADLGFQEGALFWQPQNPVDSSPVRIYATISNYGEVDALGSVRFYNTLTNTQIGTDQPISLISQKTDDVFVDWNTAAGQYTISARIIPWDTGADNPSNNLATVSLYVDSDYDGDGVGNLSDVDDDNDGVPDSEDLFSLDGGEWEDTDGDGIGDNSDVDDDNDGVLDDNDDFSKDPDESEDTDGDGIGNNEDQDDDGDGIPDIDEDQNQNGILDDGETSPLDSDSDGDGTDDGEDDFPLDENENSDFDEDGIGDNSDNDDDNDGVSDDEDTNSQNQGPIIEAGDENRSVNAGNQVVIDASESVDLDGEIVNTVIVVEKIDGNGSGSNNSSLNLEENIIVNFPGSDISIDMGTIQEFITSNGVSTNSEEFNVIANNLGITSGATRGETSGGEDQDFVLHSINDVIAEYFGNVGGMIEIDEEDTILTFSTDTNETYKYVGDNLKTRFDEPGTYRITVISQDDKNETRKKEIIVRVRDYDKLLKQFGYWLLILLAILIALKYSLRALRREADRNKANEGKKAAATTKKSRKKNSK